MWPQRLHFHPRFHSANVLCSGSVIPTLLSGCDGNLGDPDSLLCGAQRSQQLLSGGFKRKKTQLLKLFLGSLKIPSPMGISCGEPEESEVIRSMGEPSLSAFWKRVRIVDQNTENMVYLILQDVAAALWDISSR